MMGDGSSAEKIGRPLEQAPYGAPDEFVVVDQEHAGGRGAAGEGGQARVLG
jgi:hypothetical protein